MKCIVLVACIFCAFGASIFAEGASKLDFPKKNIKIIVPFAPGGGTDIAARLFADAAGKDYFNGHTLVVENMEGGGAVIGQTYVAKTAPADGYTVMLFTSSAINNTILKKVNYSYKDFKPIIMVNPDAEIICAPTKNAKFKTMKEFIEYAQKNDVLVSTPGHSSGHHVRAMNMARLMNLRFKYLHNGSAAVQVQQLMGGHCDVAFMTVTEADGAIAGGSAIGLGVMSKERVPNVPDVPTLKELGYEGWVDGASRGFAMRADTPDDVYNYIVEEFRKVALSERFKKKMTDAGMLYAADSPAEFQKYIDFTADAITALKDVLLGGQK
jgi:tripartite-type tricarboxylate transporter receptor subunit TctC